MTNLDSILKSRDITLLTKICKVKVVVFPVVMYRCMNWTMEKNLCFWTVVLEKTLECPLDSKEIKPVNPKRNQLWIFTGRTDAELQYFGHLIWGVNSLEKTLMLGKMEDRGGDGSRDETDRTHQLNGDESEQTSEDSEGQGSLACCSPWGHKEPNLATEQ